ncbi:MAG: 1-(5-phosphoribosyl)-5-[(5-phosphoribosylamino) me thylideneamino] imidazole-4-carboxamide isomerase [Cyclobacteriaceae bacterium]|nr:MAG: 1-(5-phosphoribosyl)-5-[(5-phosphoribosylamino) me thylideneamino] imidazole-4-carboxamide isomerase [Cyclobacteriaceae bacterium]
MEIIPAIDIIDGKCVRLSKGDYTRKTVYGDSPVEIARTYQEAGIKRLHLVDLDGAKAKKVVNLDVLEAIASNTTLRIDFGGGVQSTEDLKRVFTAGAAQVTGGSIAVKHPEIFQDWLREFGSEKVILGADVSNGKVAVSGWQERSDWDLFDFIDYYAEKAVKYVICTDVSKDGMLQGPAIDLYQELVKRYPEQSIIASGGVSCFEDLTALETTGVSGVIVGKAIYEGKITLSQLAEFSNVD